MTQVRVVSVLALVVQDPKRRLEEEQASITLLVRPVLVRVAGDIGLRLA